MQFDLIFRNQDTGEETKIDEIFMTPITEPLIFVYPKYRDLSRNLSGIFALVLEEKFKAAGIRAIIMNEPCVPYQVKRHEP